ncbi:Crp/Fnr family transcriptional regulator [Flavisphingomonas formosensis]|uniref:Crp/Fnr family transcriptional regulator n=1 Tax=Flavisphingomonas formosensis TaxID=861534 RepID=UPI0012FC4573|nr:Crp/Fnr family transcriptional regulator [Sphingomonas formosensis]
MTDPDLLTFFTTTFGCPADVAATLLQRSARKSHAPRTIVIASGTRTSSLFLVVSGHAVAQLYTFDGRLVLLHEYLPGDLFGALDQDAEADDHEVVATDQLITAMFATADFIALAELHACVGLALSRMLLRRLQAMTNRMYERTTLSSIGRVHAELLRLARDGDGRTIRPVPIVTDLAQRVHTSRETASRAISGLERRGILRREEGCLIIVAPEQLRALVV